MEPRSYSRSAGKPPGTLIHIGAHHSHEIELTVYNYNKDDYTKEKVKNASGISSVLKNPGVKWININGTHNLEMVKILGAEFNLHPLLLEDIVNTDQRPKIDEYSEYIFVVLKMIYYDTNRNEIFLEQVSMVLGNEFIITFQEREGDVFNIIRQRIENNVGKIRCMGADYLAYTLIDSVVDNYFLILEVVGDKIEEIENDLVANPQPGDLQVIHKLKRDMLYIRKSVWPLREIIGMLEKRDCPLVDKKLHVFFRDLYDHIIQVIDTTESYRDMLSGLLDIYMSSISNKMNEVMKVLTVIATIFIPLTFITGLYGMNFRFMPELQFKWSYPIIVLVMFVIGIGMLIYFKKKKWM